MYHIKKAPNSAPVKAVLLSDTKISVWQSLCSKYSSSIVMVLWKLADGTV